MPSTPIQRLFGVLKDIREAWLGPPVDPFTELGNDLRRRLGVAPGVRPLASAPLLPRSSVRKKSKKRSCPKRNHGF